MDIEALKQGLQGAKVEGEPVEVEKSVVETIADNIDTNKDVKVDTDDVEIATQTTDAATATDEFDTEEKLITHFAEQLGFTGKVEGEGVSALLYVAKKQLEENERIANDERVKEFLAHVDKGGDVNTWEQSQPTNLYGDIELDEADTDFTEKVVRECLIVLRNFDDEDEIKKYIDSLKDEGALFAYAEKNVPKLQKKEQDENKARKDTVDKQLKATADAAATYFKELGSVFDKGLTAGVVVDKKNLETIKKLSLPDKQNKLGIKEILDGMPTDHIATMNTLAWCLANGQPFEFKPGVKTKAPDKPIIEILNKGGNGSKQGSGNKTLASVIGNAMKR